MTDTPSGKKLGSYELGDLIGRGGMAAVYRAFQPSTNRYVAIKLIAANLAGSESFITRFEREARVAATLEHPNILPVYDFGREGDTLFLVMRLVEAGTLEDRIRRGSVPFVDAVRLFNQITSALSYAHQRGVVHRDLKPSNILLDERGNAYLGDFGIAKIANQTSVTAAGVFTGSPSYMAPELWRGETANVQSDIYAMGVVLFEMLTGELPFQADSPAALVYQHLNATPPSPHDLRGDLPRSVGAVINRALAKNPADRYQNIEQMGHDLNDVATGRYTDTPIAGAGGDILVDVKKRRSNTPVVVGVGALALIAIVVLVIVLSQPRSGGTGGAVTAEGTLTQAGTTEGQTPGTAVVVAPGTAVPTETATHSPTSTVTPSPTSTVTPTSTDTPTNTPSNTPTPTNTYTPSSTPTPTIDLTQTADSLTRTAFVVAATNVQATLIAFDLTRNAPTFTPTPTDTLTPTLTPTETLTPSPTDDSTATPSLTPSDTPTLTPTVFVTATPRAVAENAALNAGDTVVGTIDQSRLSNTYKINAAAGDRLLINVTATDGSLIPVVRLLDARGGFVDWNDSGGSLATIPLPFDGEYTIFVSRRNFENGATTGNYVMNVTLLEQNARPTATPIIPPFPTQTAIPSPTPLPATGPYPPSLLLTGDATPIALGTAVNGALENRGAERYAFLARKGESVKLTIRPADGSSLSAVMTLIDTTANQVIFASNRNGSGSRGEEVTEVLQNTGRYDLIVAATTTRDNSGDYQLSVNLVSPAEALAPGQQKIGSVNNFQTQKVYTFQGDAGRYVRITAQPANNSRFDPVLYVLAPNGRLIAFADNAAAGDPTALIDGLPLLESGTYGVVVARPGGDSGTITGEFGVTVEFSDTPPGTLYASPTSFSYTDTAVGGFDVGGTQVWAFRGTAGDIVSLNVNRLYGEGDLAIDRLTGPDGQIVEPAGISGDNSNATVRYLLRTSGVHTVALTGRSSVYILSPAVLRSAVPIPPDYLLFDGNPFSGYIAPGMGLRFRFQGRASDVVQVATSWSPRGERNVAVRLTDPAGTVQDLPYSAQVSGSPFQGVLSMTGTYQLEMFNNARTGIDYTIRLGAVAAQPTPAGNAFTLANGQIVPGTLNAGESAGYRFLARATQRVFLTVESQGVKSPQVVIIGPSGAPLDAPPLDRGGYLTLDASLPADGQYAISVNALDPASAGAFRLTFALLDKFAPPTPAVDSNVSADTTAQASPLTLGVPVAALLSGGAEVVYAFDGQPDKAALISLYLPDIVGIAPPGTQPTPGATTPVYASLEVYQPDGSLIASAATGAGIDRSLPPLRIAMDEAGKYTVVVRGRGTSQAAFLLSAILEGSAPPLPAETLAPERAQTQQLAAGGVAQYQFTPVAIGDPALLVIRPAADLRAQVELYTTQGFLEGIGAAAAPGDEIRIPFPRLSSSAYRVVVRSLDNTAGAYTLYMARSVYGLVVFTTRRGGIQVYNEPSTRNAAPFRLNGPNYEAFARTGDGQWLKVRDPQTKAFGWVSAEANNITVTSGNIFNLSVEQ